MLNKTIKTQMDKLVRIYTKDTGKPEWGERLRVFTVFEAEQIIDWVTQGIKPTLPSVFNVVIGKAEPGNFSSSRESLVYDFFSSSAPIDCWGTPEILALWKQVRQG
jgi:hypothetical protein